MGDTRTALAFTRRLGATLRARFAYKSNDEGTMSPKPTDSGVCGTTRDILASMVANLRTATEGGKAR